MDRGHYSYFLCSGMLWFKQGAQKLPTGLGCTGEPAEEVSSVDWTY